MIPVLKTLRRFTQNAEAFQVKRQSVFFDVCNMLL